jgi:alcohol dehydrogenase class IV
MVNDFLFTRIPEIYFGQGKISLLPSLAEKFGDNLLLITGARSFPESDHFISLTGEFKKRSIRFDLIKITGEPSPDLIDSIVNQYMLKDVDLVIAIGGGSVLDTGKAVTAMLSQEGFVQEFLEGVGTGRKHAGRKTPFIAVPTTSGTGSETTKNAVLSTVGEHGFKKSLRHDSLVPDIALLDPELTLTCPAEITAACGMDAFTQLLESYVSPASSKMTDALCLSGLESIKNGLLKAVNEPQNISARSNLSYAAMISGITLANAGLGLVHGFASSIGGQYEIPHGIICGTLMGEVTRTNINKLIEKGGEGAAFSKYARIGRMFSGKGEGDENKDSLELARLIEAWVQELKIPRLGDYGLQLADAKQIAVQTGLKHNPVKLNEEELTQILKQRT